MKNKAIDILRSLSPPEIKSFRDFINSPFHNKNKNVIKLFSSLKTYYPKFSSAQLTKENIYKKIYPGKNYNDLVLRILMSDLLTLLENFLITINLKKNKIDQKKFLIREFTDRKLFNFLKKELNDFSEDRVSDPEELLDKMFISSRRSEYFMLTDNQKGNDINILDYAKYLITYFLIKLPSIHYDLSIHKDLYNASPDYDFIETLINDFDLESYIEYLDKNKFEYIDLIKLYYLLYSAKKDITDDGYYFEFKKHLNKEIGKFAESEQYNLFIKLESLAIEKIEIGKKEFYNELFEIYSLMTQKNILSDSKNNFIPLELFRNIVFTGTALKEYRWTKNFINKFIERISPELRDNTYNHSLAHIYFQTREFTRSLEHLNSIKYDLFVYKADVKILAMRNYYELSAFEPAYSMVDSFKKFVHNNKNISDLFRKRYDSFILHYQKLLKAGSDANIGKLDDLEYDLNEDELVYNKNWFLEKIEELRKAT